MNDDKQEYIKVQEHDLKIDDFERDSGQAIEDIFEHVKSGLKSAIDRKNILQLKEVGATLVNDVHKALDEHGELEVKRVEVIQKADEMVVEKKNADFAINSLRAIEILYEKSKQYWDQRSVEIRTLLSEVVTGSSALSIEKREELAEKIIAYQNVEYFVRDDIVDQKKFEKDFFMRKLSLWDESNRDIINRDTSPSLNEGIKVTVSAAAIEGGLGFMLSVYRKHKEGIKLSDYTLEDWKDVGFDTLVETTKGGIRGTSVYLMTNFTSTPAPIASAMVTATFGVMSQALKLREGVIDAEEFIDTSEVMCLDVGISTISSMIGQAIIPIPVVGTIIGNTTGMFMLNIAKTYLNNAEQKIIEDYFHETQEELNVLKDKNCHIVTELESMLNKFNSLVELAFDNDVNNRFASSIERARIVGVPEHKILHNKHEIDVFFTNNEPIDL